MLKMQASFAGSFDLDCKVRSMPHSLPVMVVMILNGPNFKSQGCDGVSQASISIAQLLQCHISVRQRPGSIGIYHQNTRETPLPIYVGLVVHARTRKRDLIETLLILGCPSHMTEFWKYPQPLATMCVTITNKTK